MSAATPAGEVQNERAEIGLRRITDASVQAWCSVDRGRLSVTTLDDLFTDPYLPEVGDVYWVETEILDAIDVEPKRPAVVVEVPENLDGRIRVVTRTTEPGKPGVPHDPVPELGLRKRGTFSYIRTAEARLWKRPQVEWMGVLSEDVLKSVVEYVG